MTPIVHATGLSQWYGIVMGLNNVSFEIGPGLVGLVGPNGAGKSTLIQLITGQFRPSSGSLRVLGENPWNNPRLLRRIGYCPEGESLPPDHQPVPWLSGLAILSGLPPSDARQRAETLLDRVRLPREHWHKRLGQYSKGMRQRVKLAQALLHQPEFLVLDEPMNGLDPLGRQEIAHILKESAAQGTHIVVSSHILAELEALCREFLILHWGRVLASGSRDELRTDVPNWAEQLQVRCDQPETLARVLFDAGVLLGFDLDADHETLRFRVRDPESFYRRWLGLLETSRVVVYEIRSDNRSLRQIFEKVTA
ncbi:MAG TPA: ABC transporter ATP-binding protein [Verrucomicrobiota bacterium]|nr:ABC transporter ATP-binding protein [Verrucomicrobiota bacterium]HNU51581.1 ABC transporter ATP-binding protein [Verrucomicrobiota bacterium]